MTDDFDDFMRLAVGLSAKEKARLETPKAEERARRRWGVKSTRVGANPSWWPTLMSPEEGTGNETIP